MKLNCNCGESIHDITDYQDNKARFIPDECWEQMCEQVDKGISVWEGLSNYQRYLYQCTNCSRVLIQQADGSFISFRPEQKILFGVLKHT
ncbi:hypothetical protein [Vibrio sp. LaRot3]|uniref:hypothetical protein n=1 Tax=Vibrio sp. LaRot3 TaxID=2998829 RepID=UPI0022CDBCBA|nr:hypothetical protein [Vibrio sp. LaRot3]MDA0150670.1 hypothetical protein [Vibrio sp. LaRot3]